MKPATATVEVDGTPVAVTDGGFSTTVTAGVHSVVASATGYFTYRNNVSVTAGGTTMVTIALTATAGVNGYLAGTVSPVSATVTVDGQTETVVNGAFNITLPAGFHAIDVTDPGYLPYASLVDIVGNATTSEKIVLSPTPALSSTYLSTLAYVLIGVLAALAVIFLVLAVTGRRRSPPPPQAWPSGAAIPPPPPPQPPPWSEG